MSTVCFPSTNEKKYCQCPQKIQRNDRESVDRVSTKCRQFAFKGTNEKKYCQCPQKIQRNDRESVDRVSTKCRQFAFIGTNEKNIVNVRRKYKEMIGKVSTECRQNVDSLLSKAQMKKILSMSAENTKK